MHPIYRAGWLGFRTIFTFYFRARYFNRDNVPAQGPAILASNHCSYLDPPLIGCGLPRQIGYLARDTLFRFPVMGWLLRAWGVVPVDRDGGGAAGLRATLQSINAGNAVLLFPEGTRSPHGGLLPARSGIGLVVIKTTAPVIPVRVFGTFEAYGRHQKIPHPHPISVKYGSPLFFNELREESAHCSKERLKQIYPEVAHQIMLAIAGLTPNEG